MRRFISDLFCTYVFNIELPYVVLFFSIIFLVPFQIYLSVKVKNKLIRLLPAIFYSLVTFYYFSLYLIGRHWDGVTYLVPVFLNAYLIFMCGVGMWCGEMIKNGMSPIKKLSIAALLEVALMVAVPWWGDRYAPNEGVVVLLLVYFVFHPVIFGVSGFLAGKDVKQFWLYPLMATGIFLIGSYVIRLYGTIEMLPGYVVIALIAMLIGMLIRCYVNKVD